MNRDRLQHLITVLENVEHQTSAGFYMGSWATRNLDHVCGTACCAFGYAALDPKFQADGLKMTAEVWNGDEGDCVNHDVTSVEDMLSIPANDCWPDFDVCFGFEQGFRAAEQFFDISYPQACNLFDPDSYHDFTADITPTHVIAKIRKLLASA